jgi:hypothetical protein
MAPLKNCPDCAGALGRSAQKCRCGWIRPGAAAQPSQPAVPCDGCDQAAYSKVEGRNLCLACQAAIRHEKAAAFCKARGLNSVAEMRAYCMKLSRSFGRAPSFETWCKNMTQRTVDIIARGCTPTDEKCLERLQAAGVIDGRHQLIPMEARAVAAHAYRAERARLICQTEAELQARGQVRVPGEDDERAPA